MINYIFSLKPRYLNLPNEHGETPLHYAGGSESLTNFGHLVRGGCDPHRLNKKNASALAYVGMSAHDKDPLAISSSQIFMFAAAVLYWGSVIARRNEWATEEQATIVEWVSTTAAVFSEYTKFHQYFDNSNLGNLFKNRKWCDLLQSPCCKLLKSSLEQSWRGLAAWTATLGCRVSQMIPMLTFGYQTWNTLTVAKAALSGLTASFRNFSYRPKESIQKAVVHLVNPVHSSYKAQQSFQAWKAS